KRSRRAAVPAHGGTPIAETTPIDPPTRLAGGLARRSGTGGYPLQCRANRHLLQELKVDPAAVGADLAEDQSPRLGRREVAVGGAVDHAAERVEPRAVARAVPRPLAIVP